MKKVITFVLGSVLLVGAAGFGMQSASASPRDPGDHWYGEHHRHHRHHKHRHYRYGYRK